jgi:hypothetical protein
MGTVGRELLYWQDAPGTLEVGIDPGVEYTGLAFVSWPFGLAGTVLRVDVLDVIHEALGKLAAEVRTHSGTDMLKVKVAWEDPAYTNGHTWSELGRIRGIMDCWARGRPEVSFVDTRPCTAQQVRARVGQVPLLLDTLEPFDLTVEGLTERLPVHAREALATLIR